MLIWIYQLPYSRGRAPSEKLIRRSPGSSRAQNCGLAPEARKAQILDQSQLSPWISNLLFLRSIIQYHLELRSECMLETQLGNYRFWWSYWNHGGRQDNLGEKDRVRRYMRWELNPKGFQTHKDTQKKKSQQEGHGSRGWNPLSVFHSQSCLGLLSDPDSAVARFLAASAAEVPCLSA